MPSSPKARDGGPSAFDGAAISDLGVELGEAHALANVDLTLVEVAAADPRS